MKKTLLTIASILLLAACQPNNPSDYGCETVFGSDLDVMQAQAPNPGDTKVILHTNHGDITIRFFPEETPVAYENFVTHARGGYYDGLTFHRVMENFMIQGGCPQGTGMGGESIWGGTFGPEYSPHLRHFRGAVAMAQSMMPNSIGSQFYIVHGSVDARELQERWQVEFSFIIENQDMLLGQDFMGNDVFARDIHPAEQMEAYLRYGGTPHLDLAISESGHTVFGQVVSGMDVVDEIAAVATGEENRPLEAVVIERVTVSEF